MREIKFRGYSSEYRKWYYGYLSRPKEDGRYTIYKDKETHYPINVEEDSIGQYTGFKDKINKEIYEGDIVELEEEYVVVFGEYRGQWMLTNDLVWDDDEELRVYYDNCLVIGNTYERKLKEK